MTTFAFDDEIRSIYHKNHEALEAKKKPSRSVFVGVRHEE